MPLYALEDWRPELPSENECWVAPNASLIGRVRLAKGVSVWFGSVLRGDNDWITIGENSNVQDLCVLHTDPGIPLSLGANCSVGHGAVVHGATVGNNCIIGMGATLLNRCKIGNNSIVAANALIAGRQGISGQLAPGRRTRACGTQDHGKRHSDVAAQRGDLSPALAALSRGAADCFRGRGTLPIPGEHSLLQPTMSQVPSGRRQARPVAAWQAINENSLRVSRATASFRTPVIHSDLQISVRIVVCNFFAPGVARW